MEQFSPTKPVNRREFLKLLGGMSIGAWAAINNIPTFAQGDNRLIELPEGVLHDYWRAVEAVENPQTEVRYISVPKADLDRFSGIKIALNAEGHQISEPFVWVPTEYAAPVDQGPGYLVIDINGNFSNAYSGVLTLSLENTGINHRENIAVLQLPANLFRSYLGLIFSGQTEITSGSIGGTYIDQLTPLISELSEDEFAVFLETLDLLLSIDLTQYHNQPFGEYLHITLDAITDTSLNNKISRIRATIVSSTYSYQLAQIPAAAYFGHDPEHIVLSNQIYTSLGFSQQVSNVVSTHNPLITNETYEAIYNRIWNESRQGATLPTTLAIRNHQTQLPDMYQFDIEILSHELNHCIKQQIDKIDSRFTSGDEYLQQLIPDLLTLYETFPNGGNNSIMLQMLLGRVLYGETIENYGFTTGQIYISADTYTGLLLNNNERITSENLPLYNNQIFERVTHEVSGPIIVALEVHASFFASLVSAHIPANSIPSWFVEKYLSYLWTHIDWNSEETIRDQLGFSNI